MAAHAAGTPLAAGVESSPLPVEVPAPPVRPPITHSWFTTWLLTVMGEAYAPSCQRACAIAGLAAPAATVWEVSALTVMVKYSVEASAAGLASVDELPPST